MHQIKIDAPEEEKLRLELEGRTDPDGLRMKRFLAMPDLSRTVGNPISELAKRIISLPDFSDFDVVQVPELVPARESFDLFNFPPDHPARSRSDTYYLNDDYILRTHTTIMWYYYLGLQEIKQKIANGERVGVLSYGKVYRKDEIDRRHMNVFHQMDGLYLARRDDLKIGIPELQDVLSKIVKAIYGPEIKYRFNKDTFPYTDPSLEMEVQIGDRWVEVLGSGVVHDNVLKTLGVDPSIYNGWAFGFGLERLAILSMDLPDIRLLWSKDERVTRQLKLGNKFKEVSKYPPVVRDISFVVPNTFAPNDYFDLIRDIGGDLVEEVELLDKYENIEKFGEGKLSYTYRIVYRSNERTLLNEEVAPLQSKIEAETKQQFGAEIR
jgi:phenylalanyl-tRNA synthetase alpha chain